MLAATPALRSPPLLLSASSLPQHSADGEDEQFYSLRFDGLRRLYGAAAPERLQKARVVVVGLGGVGSWAVEALARSGVGSLVLVDLDEICISNTNRQLHALRGTVGKSKAVVLAERVGEINPSCATTVREQWVLVEDASVLLEEEAAHARARGETLLLLDAVDGYKEKAAMVVAAYEQGIHLVLCGAAGGMSDPTLVRVGDLVDVADDRLLASVRRELRKRHGFPRGVALRHKGAGSSSQAPKGFHAAKSARQSTLASKLSDQWGVPCVYSLERTDKASNGPGTLCDRFGTACFATGAFGFAAASQLTTVIARGEKLPKRPRIAPGGAPRGLKQAPERVAPEEAGAAQDGADTPAGSSAEPEAAGGKGAPSGRAAGGSRRSGDPRMSVGGTGAAASSSSGVGESGEDDAMAAGCVECDDSSQQGASGSSPMLFDSHCHAIAEAHSILSGPTCGGLVLMSTGEAEWALAEQVAAASPARHAIGVHPWHLHEQRAGWEGRLREALTAQPAAAVGEAGLDRARLECAWEVQLDAFTAQLRVASDLRRPLVVHCVRSDGAMLDLLREAPALPPTLVMHAFGGSAETARALLSLVGRRGSRIFFGFSPGAARLKRAPAVLQAIPAELLLLESDKHTASAACAAVSDACQLVSASRGWSLEETAARTAQNARDAFSIMDHDAQSA